MYARAVEEAGVRLRELHRDLWRDFSLAAVALALSLAATAVLPELAVPLFVGGLAVGVLGVRAALEQSEIIDRLAGDPDAYVISEIRKRAARDATMERRRSLAADVRWWLREPQADRVTVVASELEALAADLDDAALELDPACAVACVRLLSDSERSPLLIAASPVEELRSRIIQIRFGFGVRALDRQADRAFDPLGGTCVFDPTLGAGGASR